MKLPNGFGSVYKLSGKRRKPWCARKTIGWTFDEERQKSFPVYVFIGYYQSRSEALLALTDYNRSPYDLQALNLTFTDVFERFLKQHCTKVSEASITEYRKAYKLCESIHRMKFSEIKLHHLQTMVDESGKNKPTLKKLKNLLNLMWNYAVMTEIITPDKNMVKYLNVDKGNPKKLNREIFSTDQVDLLWKHEQSDILTIVLILIYTGVRIGELLDLKKEDVHLQERWFYVRESKTEAGVREVPIAEKIVPFVEKWLDTESEYLISNEGHHLDYKKFHGSNWQPLMKELGMKHAPHDTRHTCVSMLTTAGVDERIIKKIIGHRGKGVTESVYTHIELSVKLEAINKI